ncbi:acid phosphatase [Phenylobacterium soli]|uniref:Acid phosphatase n=1 Tax=Phenylobacterium soli TaxID=2170551 RepID=A0A328ALK2_9CAUL|nr:phosphatase PAP2 family protein [Phenylobacterium soli]RAK53738.1 phosphatase PAP2 family protein [Phenylobacterium soli]
MGMKLGAAAVANALILVAGAAIAQQAAPQAAMTPAPRASGYLGESAPDTYAVLPPAPRPGDPRDRADREIYRATRRYEHDPRWAMAQNDANSAGIVKDLACALGVELTPKNAPRTLALLAKVAPDASRATNRPKDIYQRPRPYLRDKGAICVPRDASLAASPDYPSGHNTWSWTVGLILAELAPDRAAPILTRARAFGENRLVCGVHSLSAVDAGRDNGAILVAALHGVAQFRSDMDAARAEVAAARAAGPAPDAAACAQEAALIAKNPY